jgi:hypothetical protein
MPLYIKAGTSSLLRVGTSLASGSACCCATGSACCTDYFGCIDGLTQAECEVCVNVDFKGSGTSCASNPCACTGATVTCCLSSGTITTTDCNCTLFGGKTVSSPSNCPSLDCATYGSCCWPDGTCVDYITKCMCDQSNGSFSATACSSRTCNDETNTFSDTECVLCTVLDLEIHAQSGSTTCTNTSACSGSGGACGAANTCSPDITLGFGYNCQGSPQCSFCSTTGGNGCHLSATQCVLQERTQTQLLTTWAACKAFRSNFYIDFDIPTSYDCYGLPNYDQYLLGTTTFGTKACTAPSCTTVTGTNTYSRLELCYGSCPGTNITTSTISTTNYPCTGCNGCL